MHAHNMVTVFIAMIFIFITSLPTSFQKEEKGKNTQRICNSAFQEAWKQLCALKAKKRFGRSIIKETIHNLQQSDFIKPNDALQFLHPLHRKRRQTDNLNAHEECCIETCSLEEVNEYPC
ncbi:uncharacterized protein LOC130655661 [Hydractinia symbiolongicarpus]|uniref:uncharacterized protein LOC130655661 n=1 Tax=Hydractinia symbiolongicarpus TaxID=13093 RepID=UPI00254B0A03|nr:uncharacterized protein LOC130655661 [Hydractinia symbiolongicarpus]